MQSNVTRRNSSKQGLQNLLRLTTQRSIEDAEEIERERRRRARELCRHQGSEMETDAGDLVPGSLDHASPEESITRGDIGFKASCQLAQEEDEGFADWTQRAERRPQHHSMDHHQAEAGRQEWSRVSKVPEWTSHSGVLSSRQKQEEEGEGVRGDHERRKNEEVCKKEERLHRQRGGVEDVEGETTEEAGEIMMGEKSVKSGQEEQESGKVEKVTDGDKMMSCGVKAKRPSSDVRQACDGERTMEAFRETECRPEKADSSRWVRESWGLGNSRQGETHADLEDRRDELQVQEENELENKADSEYSCTISERTESLNRSLTKSNIVKTENLAVSKIDDKLEQYTQAIESSSKEVRSPKQILMEIPSPPEPVASKKSFFETVDVCSQKLAKPAPSKDVEGLKVGVAELITHWVKGNPDDSARIPSLKPADVKSGDVLYKKSIWETLGDSSSSGRPKAAGKAASSSKRYKFVVTGHGKYEKIPVDEDTYDEYTNGQSGGMGYEDS